MPAARSGAVLRFSYGIMGSGKSTVALQVHHNLAGRGLHGALLHPPRPRRHLGVEPSRACPGRPPRSPPTSTCWPSPAAWPSADGLDFLVCDEVQFYAVDQIDQLAAVVDELGADVFAYGLLTDFRGQLFDGTRRMLEVADEHVPLGVETRCWCGRRATHNARLVNGAMTLEGETVVIGDIAAAPEPPLFGDVVTYELLCRRHFLAGATGT